MSVFNEVYYLANNPDVANAVDAGAFGSGWDHFVQFGETEGRSFDEPAGYGDFDEVYYLANNPDVANAVETGAFGTGWEHYVLFGEGEGRSYAEPAGYGDFDEEYYLANNADVANAVDAGDFGSGWEHYVLFGETEGRSYDMPDGYGDFNEEYYLANNPDVGMAVETGAFGTGWDHYVQFGETEGRSYDMPEGYDVEAPVDGDTFTFTSTLDVLTGTDGDDTFYAVLGEDNDTSGRITTFNSGDFADGGDGNDTLIVTAEDEGDDTEDNIVDLYNIENVVVRNYADDDIDLDASFWFGVDNYGVRGGYDDVSIDYISEAFSTVTMDTIREEMDFDLEVENAVFTGDDDAVTVVLDNAGLGPIKVPKHSVDDDIWQGYTYDPDGTQDVYVGWPDYSTDGEEAYFSLENYDDEGVVEIFNIVSTGGNSRGNFVKFDDNTVEAVEELNISGDTDLKLQFDDDGYCDDRVVETVDASDLDANLWLRGVSSIDMTNGDGVAIIGALGDNDLKGGEGNDTFTTGDGDDIIGGGAGNDVINAGNGDNEINAGMGDDTIITGDGDDFIKTGGTAYRSFTDYNDVDEDGNTLETIDDWNFQDTVNAGAGDDIVQVGDGLSAYHYDDDLYDPLDPSTFFAGGDDIDGGAGTDTLWMDAEAAVTATADEDDTFADLFDNFEIIKFGNIYDTVDMAYLDNIQDVILGYRSSDATILGLSDGADLQLWDYHDYTITVELTDVSGDETFNLFLAGGDPSTNFSTANNFGDLTLNDVETLNLDSSIRCKDFDMLDGDLDDGIDPFFITQEFDLDMDALETLNISGTASLDISGNSLTTVETVDAADFDGSLSIDLTGNANDVTVTAGDGDNEIIGGDGADTITVGDGDNYIEGGADDDIITAGDGDGYVDDIGNDLYGDDGDDTITSGDGDDFLTGGLGIDTLTGGAGADTFNYDLVAESQATTVDMINDFVSGEDKLDLLDVLGGATDVNYVGEAINLGSAQTALQLAGTAGTAVLDASDSTLYVDVNGDGFLTDLDMAINLVGVTDLVGEIGEIGSDFVTL